MPTPTDVKRPMEAGASLVTLVDQNTVTKNGPRIALFRDGTDLDELIEANELLEAFGVFAPSPLTLTLDFVNLGAVSGNEQQVDLSPRDFGMSVPVLLVRNNLAYTNNLYTVVGSTLTWLAADVDPLKVDETITLWPFASPQTLQVDKELTPFADLSQATSGTLDATIRDEIFPYQLQPGSDTTIVVDGIPKATFKITGDFDQKFFCRQADNTLVLTLTSGQTGSVGRKGDGTYESY